MNLTLSILIILSTSTYQKIHPDVLERSFYVAPIIQEVSEEANIPEWVLWGIARTESTMRWDITGDRRRSYGLMQIRHNRKGFSWIPYLRERGYPLKNSLDLLDPVINIRASAEVITYYAYKYRRWPTILRAYNAGRKWRQLKNHWYYRKVRRYGKRLEEIHDKQICY